MKSESLYLSYSKIIVFVFFILSACFSSSVFASSSFISRNGALPDSTINPVACHLFEANKDQLVFSDNIDYETSVNNETAYADPAGLETGCMLTHSNEKWVLFQVIAGDQLTFDIQNTNGEDLDAVIWGAVHPDSLDFLCQKIKSFPISCEYSTGLPHLTVFQPKTGYYYLMMISNSSNQKTTVFLNQPSGGQVKFAYLCPSNILLDERLEVTPSGAGTVTLNNEIPSTKIEALSNNSVVLMPGFSTGDNVVFEANIKECTLINTPYSDTTSAPLPPCEEFTNHGSHTPHLYANTYSNELVGTVFANSQPEYSTDFVNWYKLDKMGIDDASDRFFWAYRHPFTRDALVYLRTREGCVAYGDVRLTRPYSYLGEEDTVLPALAPVDSFMNINSPFFVSTTMGEWQSVYDVYTIYLKPGLVNLGYRINGEGWRYNVENVAIWEEYNQRYVNVTRINFFSAPKDFILDFTQDAGQTIDRYVVTRNSAGGHFSVTTTFTRVEDSTVTVNTFQGDINVPMQLGGVNSSASFGNSFYLGHREPGNYIYPLTSSKGDYVLDEHLLVRVRNQ